MNGPALLSLQRLDTELDQIAGRRRRLAEHEAVASATAAVRAWESAVAEQRRTIEAASAAIAEAEAEGHTLDTKQQRLEAQLKTVIAPREAEALMSEIATLRAKHSDLDDAELAEMERQGDAESALAALLADEPRLSGEVAMATEVLDAALAALAAEEAEVRRARDEAAASIEVDDLRHYDEMRARHDGVAIVTISGGRCSGCHLDISRAELDEISRAQGPALPECPQCARLVVV